MNAFDADDSLWYYERLFAEAPAKIAKLLTPFCTIEENNVRLNQVELLTFTKVD